MLTASTSEAYSLLFKLLCAPDGDAVMVPVPSYPLFDHLTRSTACGRFRIGSTITAGGRWRIDDLDERWTPAVRAVLAVSPNNPTGSVLSADELEALVGALRRARGGAHRRRSLCRLLRCDPTSGAQGLPTVTRQSALTFRLGGLSKSAGLPQVKLGWMLVDGPDDARARRAGSARADLRHLPVGLDAGAGGGARADRGGRARARADSRARARELPRARRAASRGIPPIEVLHADAGWSAVLRVPSTRSEEDLVVDLLDRDGVLVHPGFFFDFPHEAFLVVSLLPEPQVFAEGVRRVLERADA